MCHGRRGEEVVRSVLTQLIAWPLMLAAALVFAGCDVSARLCTSARDCFGGEACVFGECVARVVLDDEDVDVRPADAGPDLPPGDCRLNEAMCAGQVCNVSTGLCEDCQRDLQCGDGGLCDRVRGTCTCAPGFHPCGGQCVTNTAVESCGDRCEACPAVADATAVCTAEMCGFSCSSGFRPCGDCGLSRECIQCEANSECDDYGASRCTTTGLCESCQSNADCGHLDRKVCSDGTCVTCDIGASSACGTMSCDPATKECTSTPLQSRDWCRSCVADSECQPNHRCVPMFFGGTDRPNAYCLVEANGQCLAPDPVQVQRDSLSGIREEYYCAIREDLVTCEAIKDFGRPCSEDTECGEPRLADGLCRTFDGLRQCTYACSATQECVNGTTCIGNPPDNSYCARF